MTLGCNTTKNEDGTIASFAGQQVVLGRTIDSRMNFYSQLKQLCK